MSPHRVTDFPDARRAAAAGDRRPDDFEDGALPLGETGARSVGSGLRSGVFVLSLIAANLTGFRAIIKHVFSVSRQGIAERWLSVGFRTIDTPDQMFGNIEHVIEYIFEHRSERPQEGIDMTLLDDRHLMDWNTAWAFRLARAAGLRFGTDPDRRCLTGPDRPGLGVARCATGAVAWRCPGRARAPVSTAATVGSVSLAALITPWWAAGAGRFRCVAVPAAVPDQLAVVQVRR